MPGAARCSGTASTCRDVPNTPDAAEVNLLRDRCNSSTVAADVEPFPPRSRAAGRSRRRARRAEAGRRRCPSIRRHRSHRFHTPASPRSTAGHRLARKVVRARRRLVAGTRVCSAAAGTPGMRHARQRRSRPRRRRHAPRDRRRPRGPDPRSSRRRGARQPARAGGSHLRLTPDGPAPAPVPSRPSAGHSRRRARPQRRRPTAPRGAGAPDAAGADEASRKAGAERRAGPAEVGGGRPRPSRRSAPRHAEPGAIAPRPSGVHRGGGSRRHPATRRTEASAAKRHSRDFAALRVVPLAANADRTGSDRSGRRQGRPAPAPLRPRRLPGRRLRPRPAARRRKPKDFDVATSATPNDIRRLFRNCRIIGRRFRLAHIFFGPKIIETSTFRANPREIEEDDGETRRDARAATC